MHCLDGQTYSLFMIRVLGFEPQLSYTVVNAIDLLQFLLTMQNMPVASASQTNDFAGVVSNLSPTLSSFSSAREFMSSSCLRMELFWAGISRKLRQDVLYNASSVRMNISHAHDTWPRDVAIILQLRPKTACGSTNARMCYRSRYGGAGCVSRVRCRDVGDRKWQNDMGQVT